MRRLLALALGAVAAATPAGIAADALQAGGAPVAAQVAAFVLPILLVALVADRLLRRIGL